MRFVVFSILFCLISVFTLSAQSQRDRSAREGVRTTLPTPVTDDDVFTVVEVAPEFPGGQSGLMGYLGSITYPDDALDNNWQGKVYLTFVIEKDGTITDVKISRSSGYDVLDNAAKYHIETMPPWKPGTQRGKPVRVKYTLPMVFKLG